MFPLFKATDMYCFFYFKQDVTEHYRKPQLYRKKSDQIMILFVEREKTNKFKLDQCST